jgi:hypothetical protein
MDFAENFICNSVDEVQSAYWNSTAVTIHPVVAYFKDDEGQLKHMNFVYISDDLGHNFGTVYAILKQLTTELDKIIPDGVQMIHYWTDSPSSQYRNKSAFYIISDHKTLLGVPAIWNYFEVGHGKGPCDGIGGTSKRIADLAIKQGKIVVQEALDYYDNVSRLHKSASYRFISSHQIAAVREEVAQMNKYLVPVKGTMQIHQVAAVGKGEIKTSVTSCYCSRCIYGDFHEFKSAVLQKDTNRQNRSQSWNADPIQTESEKADSMPNGKSYEVKRNTATSDGPDMKQGDWVAVLYEGDWHIGKIKSVDDEGEFEITFLRRAKTAGVMKILFKWPLPEDVLFVTRGDIMYKLIADPNPVGRSARSFEIQDDDLQIIIEIFHLK